MTDDVTVIRVGTHIESNGGDVLTFKQGRDNTTIVFCYLPHNKVTPFVIHTYMENSGICIRGDYARTLDEAIAFYEKRMW